MKTRGLSREAASILPWIAAALLWFGVLVPMKAERQTRLADQARARRERLKAEQAGDAVDASRTRVNAMLGQACRASTDAAALRQRTIAATRGLILSPVTLSVAGEPTPGASVDAEGSRGAILELLRRLGNPTLGGFVRTVNLRQKDGRFAATVTTGVFGSLASVGAAARPCDGAAPAFLPDPTPTPKPPPRVTPKPVAISTPEVVLPPIVEPPPFTLVGFLVSGGRTRVSIRVGDQVRVASAGDLVNGWRCESIDRDEGATFISPSGRRIVLKQDPSDH